MIVAWKGNDKLGEYTGFRLDVDPTAMLFDNDVMGHRKAEPGPFPGWFGSEKGIEHLLSYLGRDAAAVVANSDFDCVTKVTGGSVEDRFKRLVALFDLAPGRSVEAVGNQI
jgi:hypothetical protein